MIFIVRKVGLLFFFVHYIQHCFSCRPSDSTVSEDARIEPKTVATLALATQCVVCIVQTLLAKDVRSSSTLQIIEYFTTYSITQFAWYVSLQ
jgi:hypothetical protein